MPFSLYNAPAIFERLMEKVLYEVLHKICLVYLDDVILYSKTFTGMLENLREVFLRLRGANLKINLKKCSLFSRKVKYLGHIISEKEIATDPEKTSARAGQFQKIRSRCGVSWNFLIIVDLLKDFLRRLDLCLN